MEAPKLDFDLDFVPEGPWLDGPPKADGDSPFQKRFDEMQKRHEQLLEKQEEMIRQLDEMRENLKELRENRPRLREPQKKEPKAL